MANSWYSDPKYFPGWTISEENGRFYASKIGGSYSLNADAGDLGIGSGPTLFGFHSAIERSHFIHWQMAEDKNRLLELDLHRIRPRYEAMRKYIDLTHMERNVYDGILVGRMTQTRSQYWRKRLYKKLGITRKRELRAFDTLVKERDFKWDIDK